MYKNHLPQKSKKLSFFTSVHEGVGEYLFSKKCQNEVPTCSCEYGLCYGPNVALTSALKAYENQQYDLESSREFAKKKQVILQSQWQELFQDEENFKQTVIAMNDFLLTNYNKRERAKLRLQEDKKLNLERGRKIEEIQMAITKIRNTILKMEENIKDLLIYKNFLTRVININSEYKYPEDLIMRHEALVETRQYLADRQAMALSDLEEARLITVQALAKAMEDGRLIILGLCNTIADLRSRYFTAMRKAMHWESIVYNIRNHMKRKYDEISLVKTSCWNLYKMMCARKGEEYDPEDECSYEKQLSYIKKTLQLQKHIAYLANSDGSKSTINEYK